MEQANKGLWSRLGQHEQEGVVWEVPYLGISMSPSFPTLAYGGWLYGLLGRKETGGWGVGEVSH